ncbi:GDSL-type esterase/lipase family protein [Marinilabilia salmonicolor]|uniref:GDSL-type esterase/lipase family protein n=1 Tax=Marinilabilia salmonicolor TaxID=989 RepID=UPI00029ABFF5|nr:GDSL-type esterase/lipase family protein [Marinilabilia salmonicolor]
MKTKKQNTCITSPGRVRNLLILLLLAAVSLPGFSQKTRVACIGNSVTFGYKIDKREENSYPAQLQELLGNEYLVGNFGKSGATLLRKGHRPYMEQEEFKQAVAFQPDVIIISLGLNDTDPRNWPNYRDDFIADYMSLIDSFRKADGSKPEVWIGRMTPIFHSHPRFMSGTRDWFWQIQKTIEQVAENCNARIIDWHTPLHTRPDLFPDALHPIKEGAAIMAQMAFQHITGDFGGIRPASIFGDHMVLQRDTLIPVWGLANRNEEIKLKLNNQKITTRAGVDGKWKVNFRAMPAGGPHKLKIEAESRTITFKDIMIGEVWLCTGQSNMAFKVRQSAKGQEPISNASSSQIRLMNFHPIAETNNTAWDSTTLSKVNNLDYLSGKWEPATEASVADFSAIGWYFGKKLQEELDVPVGLIHVAVGGAPTESFIDRKTLEFHPRLVNFLYSWNTNDHVMQWCRERAQKNISQANNNLQRHPYHPAYLFEAGISKISGYPIKGVLWYQGESNAHNIELHEILFPTMVKSWQIAWNQPNLPFIFAQLSSLNRPSWPHFRDSQRRLATEIPYTWMVVTSDFGNETDVHPVNKYPVGKRMAQTALNQIYGLTHIPTGNNPILSVKRLQNNIEIKFSHSDQLQTKDSEPIRELEVASKDGIFKPEAGSLEGNNIIIPDPERTIKHIRYGWRPYSKGNIVNEHGIPVSTFQVEVPHDSNH